MVWYKPWTWLSTESDTMTPPPIGVPATTPVQNPYGGRKKTRRGGKKGGKRTKTGRSKRA